MLSSLYREIHIINGSLKCADSVIISKLLDKAEEVIDFIMTNDRAEVNSWLSSNFDLFSDLLSILWESRNTYSKGVVEKDFFLDTSFKERYMTNFKDFQSGFLQLEKLIL